MSFNLAAVHEAIAEAFPDREAIVFGDRRLTYGDVNARTRRLGNYLRRLGLGCHAERDGLQPWESGQDHLALYLYNGNEYIEGMLGAYQARVAPFNVNYRYVEEELVYLLNNARARAIVFHSEFAPHVAAIRAQVPSLTAFLQVADDSGEGLLDGAVWYEEALASASAERPDLELSPDDLYILYTGGTTGMPKGVLWRQADILVGALGGRSPEDGHVLESLEELVERARAGGGATRALPSAPFMHGAGHWIALNTLNSGNTVVIQRDVRRLDPEDIWSTVVRERVSLLLIVGDAFARPLLDYLREHEVGDLSALQVILSGGAALNASLKQQFLDRIPHVTIMDSVGSSETGGQGAQLSTRETGATTGRFMPGPGNVVLSESLDAVLAPGHEGLGWWAKAGHVPLGYLQDPEKTHKTFPEIDGVRYSVPGDRARLLSEGSIELHGRDSVTINSGGEKIFAEEVEDALKHHPAVYDAVVTARPSERWGQEVVAVVQLRAGAHVTEDALLAECGRRLARYKWPKAFVFREQILRSPSGKADYRWAKEQAASAQAAG